MRSLLDLVSGITKSHSRFGIAQGGYIAYVESSDSGTGFRYFVCSDDVRLCEEEAPDFFTARQRAEAKLRLLCTTPGK